MSARRRKASAVEKQAGVFASLGDKTRLRLISELSTGKAKSISQLTAKSNLTRQGVTKHLRVLEKSGIVRSFRLGRENLFEFEPRPLDDIKKYLLEISRQWDDALSRLKSFVEN